MIMISFTEKVKKHVMLILLVYCVNYLKNMLYGDIRGQSYAIVLVAYIVTIIRARKVDMRIALRVSGIK
jgi:hypothetical protein